MSGYYSGGRAEQYENTYVMNYSSVNPEQMERAAQVLYKDPCQRKQRKLNGNTGVRHNI